MIIGVFLVAHDRLLAEVVMAAGGHRLVPSLVDGRLVAGLPGPVLRLTVGGALLFTVPPPLVLSGIAALVVAASVRPVHLPTPFRCRGSLPGTPRAVRWQWVFALPRSPAHSHWGGQRRLPVHYLAGIAAGIAGLVVLPYAEELLRRGRRAR
jgi:hypothetical protein